MTELTLERLRDAVAGAGAAIRAITRLQPAGGPGDKVFPPTYQGASYVYEERQIGDEKVPCVLLDSVQSQANRMEEALLTARRAGRLAFPDIQVDFSAVGLTRYGTISTLQAPHRIADAILRDSLFDGMLFRNSSIGQKFVTASPANATGLLELCPAALIFGTWDSTGLGTGGRGARFARCLVSEIIGVGAVEGKRAAGRVDPLGIERSAAVIYQSDSAIGWTTNPERAQKNARGEPQLLRRGGEQGGRPSVINHGNISPTISVGGVTIQYAAQTTVLSLAGLRKLHFPTVDGRLHPARDSAARTYLAALALCAVALQYEAGYDLRSRCVLIPEERRIELIPNRIGPAEEISLTVDHVLTLCGQAAEQLVAHDFSWSPRETITLVPCDELIGLIRKNEAAIMAGRTEESEDA